MGEQPREPEEAQESYAEKKIREARESFDKQKEASDRDVARLQEIRAKNLKGEKITDGEREFLKQMTTSSTMRKFNREQGEK